MSSHPIEDEEERMEREAEEERIEELWSDFDLAKSNAYGATSLDYLYLAIQDYEEALGKLQEEGDEPGETELLKWWRFPKFGGAPPGRAFKMKAPNGEEFETQVMPGDDDAGVLGPMRVFIVSWDEDRTITFQDNEYSYTPRSEIIDAEAMTG